jgi:hypothetical protein
MNIACHAFQWLGVMVGAAGASDDELQCALYACWLFFNVVHLNSLALEEPETER